MGMCVKRGCDRVGDITLSNGAVYCIRHHRAYRMRAGAKQHNKWCPSLDVLIDMLEKNRLCPDCGKIMGWYPSRTRKGDTVTLQHYEDGTVGVLCHSCNTSDGLRNGRYRGAVKALTGGGDA